MEDYLKEKPNLEYIVELIGKKDAEFEQKFVTELKSEFSKDLGKYLYHIKIEEPRAAAEMVHKLKFKFNVLGMHKSIAFAEEHKERLHKGNTELDDDFKRILKIVNNFLESV